MRPRGLFSIHILEGSYSSELPRLGGGSTTARVLFWEAGPAPSKAQASLLRSRLLLSTLKGICLSAAQSSTLALALLLPSLEKYQLPVHLSALPFTLPSP